MYASNVCVYLYLSVSFGRKADRVISMTPTVLAPVLSLLLLQQYRCNVTTPRSRDTTETFRLYRRRATAFPGPAPALSPCAALPTKKAKQCDNNTQKSEPQRKKQKSKRKRKQMWFSVVCLTQRCRKSDWGGGGTGARGHGRQGKRVSLLMEWWTHATVGVPAASTFQSHFLKARSL